MEQRRTEGGSQTVTQEAAPILRLRNDQQQERPARTRPGVRWTEEVVDNEHMNKKKSKICCIFHPQREFGEESGDSSSDSSSDSSEDENESKSNDKDQDHADHGDHCCDHGHGKIKKIKKKSKPNAYERQPKYTNESRAPPK